MEAKQGFILVICSMILAGEVACFPSDPASDVRTKSSFSQDDAAALAKHEDWREILEKIPGFLFPILEKILKGIANSKDPMDILKSILEGEKPSKKKKKNKKNKNKKGNENENEENKKKEPEQEETSGSENSEKEPQE